jgi:hypothetical protein
MLSAWEFRRASVRRRNLNNGNADRLASHCRQANVRLKCECEPELCLRRHQGAILNLS